MSAQGSPPTESPAFDDLVNSRPRGLVNSHVPNVARIYDYLLGGKDNYAADRAAAAELLACIPDARDACYQNRGFLQRAVRFLAVEAGICQFIDIGTGLPTQGNVHEIAQQARPGARVVYVDYDPVVVMHAQALLATSASVGVISGDLRDPDGILAHPGLRKLIDPSEPVAVLLVAILHFIADDDGPHAIVEKLKAAVPSGSYLVLSHITGDHVAAEKSEQARAVYQRATEPVFPRWHGAISRFFDGLEIVPPGVVSGAAWRAGQPSPGQGRTLFYAGAGRKP